MSFVTNWIAYGNRQVKKFSFWDVKLAQWALVGFALIIVKLFPQIMTLSIWWFVGLLVVCVIKPAYVFCLKKDEVAE
jgi:hypothetical protein